MKLSLRNTRYGRVLGSLGVIAALALASTACQGPTVADYAVGGA
jgi:hypothetical protein